MISKRILTKIVIIGLGIALFKWKTIFNKIKTFVSKYLPIFFINCLLLANYNIDFLSFFHNMILKK